VRDLAGALVTGQAATLASAATLSDPAGVASALAVTVTEIGTTGWYLATFTPDAAGQWVLTLTDPAAPTASGQDFDYPISVADVGIPGVPLAGYGLTTLERVHRMLRLPDSQTSHDDLLEVLIDGITSQIEQRAQRHIGLYSYIEDLDGWGTPTLWLAQGPLVSLAAVEELAYTSGGVAATAVDPTLYRGVGISHGAGGDDDRAGVQRTDGGTWGEGRGRWRVTYDAGYTVIPPALTLDATRLVVAHFRRSDLEGLVSEGRADLSSTPIDVAELDRLTERIAGQWRLRVAAI